MDLKAVTINSVVLLGISDHYTRNKVQNKNRHQRIVGGLMGKKSGGIITVNHSFEFAYQVDNSGIIQNIDSEHMMKKVGLIKTNDPFNHFKDDDFVGWYSTTDDSNFAPNDQKFHDTVSHNLNQLLAGEDGGDNSEVEPAYYLCISLNDKVLKNPNLKEVPLNLYTKSQKQDQFQQVPTVINAEKGEIISIESSSVQSSGDQSQFAGKMQSTLNAVNRYNEKIEGLIAALDNPNVGKNMILMRELKGILNSQPRQFSQTMDKSMLEQFSDATITSFLSGLSSTNKTVQEVYSCNGTLKNSGFKKHDMMF